MKKLFEILDEKKDQSTLQMIELGKLEAKQIINETYDGNENVVVKYVGNNNSDDYTYNAELQSLFGNKNCHRCGSSLQFNIGPKGYCVRCSNSQCSFRLPYGEDHIVINKKYTTLPTVFAKVYIQNNINNYYGNCGSESAIILDAECFVEDGLILDENDQDANRIFLNALTGTQVRIANVFHHFYNDCLVYCKPGWFKFNGSLWEEFSVDLVRALLHSDSMLQPFNTAKKFYKKGCSSTDTQTNNNAKIRKITKIIEDLENKGPQDGILEQCKSLFGKTYTEFIEKLNSNKCLIGFTNGVYDYKLGEFRPSTKEDMVSFSVGYAYDEDKMNDQEIKAKILERFNQIFPLKDLLHYVLKFLASCLTGYAKDQLIHIGQGNGSNGKSLLMGLMAETLGTYAAKMESSFICGPTPAADKPTPTLTSLVRKRFAYVSETVPGDKLNEQLFKALSGEDRMNYRPLYGEIKCFTPEFKMFMVCNDLPSFNGNDYAMLRRLRVIPFISTFVDDDAKVNEENNVFKKDSTLSEEILNYKEAFMGLLLDYLKIYKKEGLVDIPDSIKNATANYTKENNVYKQFIDEMTIEKMGSHVKVADLYDSFRHWASANGHKLKSTTSTALGKVFGLLLKKHRASGGCRVYLDIALKSMC